MSAQFAMSLSQSHTTPSNVDTIFVSYVVTTFLVSRKQSVQYVANQMNSRVLCLTEIFNARSKTSKYIAQKGVTGLVSWEASLNTWIPLKNYALA